MTFLILLIGGVGWLLIASAIDNRGVVDEFNSVLNSSNAQNNKQQGKATSP